MSLARLIAAVLALAAVLLAWLAVERARLPYNSEGRYFDAAESVVYHEGSALVAGVLATLAALIALAVLLVARRK